MAALKNTPSQLQGCAKPQKSLRLRCCLSMRLSNAAKFAKKQSRSCHGYKNTAHTGLRKLPLNQRARRVEYMSDDFMYHDDVDTWAQPEPPEHCWCSVCEYVHKIELEWAEDVQGVEGRTGVVWVDTGNSRCSNCQSDGELTSLCDL